MIIKHNQVFTHNKQQTILLFDRVLLSIDDKSPDEFVFATIQDENSKQLLYFVCATDSYNEAKKHHPKVFFAGFWHSLFVSNKIDLTNDKAHYHLTEELVYFLNYSDGNIDSGFELVSEIDSSITSNIDAELGRLEVLISPQDKIKAIRRKKNMIIYSLVGFWGVIGLLCYVYVDYQHSKTQKVTLEINALNKDVAGLNRKINKQKQDIYVFDKSLSAKIKALTFLSFRNISLLGDIDLDKPMIAESKTELHLLQSFVKSYPQYKLKRHAEALPTIEVVYE